MPIDLQAKLLRTLEDGCIMPIGATREKQVNVRILAATNAELQARIAGHTFREDLYFRLARFRVEIPPLRERKEDIPLLANHFLSMFASEMGISSGRADERASSPPRLPATPPTLNSATLDALMNYSFPGNIREMKNMIEHALIKSGGAVIQPEHLSFIEKVAPSARGTSKKTGGRGDDVFPVSQNPDQAQALMVQGALAQAEGDISAAARLLGISPARIDQFLGNTHENSIPNSPATDEEKQILAYVREHNSINNTECRDFLAVDLHHASYLLKKMHRNGLLEREGSRRWSRYRLP